MREFRGAAVLVEQPGTIEIRNGLFYRTVIVGDESLCLAMRATVFYQNLLLAEEAFAKWRLSTLDMGHNIVPFRRL